MSETSGPASRELFARAIRVMPGGVNSPVRAFKPVGGEPLFFERARGARLVDVDGRELVDHVGSWGPMILGHGHPEVTAAVAAQLARGTSFGAPTALEVELAELVVALVPGVEMVRMVSSGTEATMAAIRVARGVTGRAGVVKFEGCYHGHADPFLIKAGSGAATLGQPDSPGVTPGTAADTHVARYNDLDAVRAILDARPEGIAAVIVEPVVGNMGVVPPKPGFLEGLRDLCTRSGALLVLDEVMTGFRLALGGAQARYGIDPDLTTLGKILGGGLPAAAYGGKRRFMEAVAPAGPIYQAGTLSGNPLAMAAGLATLRILQRDPGIYARLEAKGCALEEGFAAALHATGAPARVARVGSMWTLFFAERPVRSWDDAATADRARFARWFAGMLRRGIYLAPSQFEANFLSDAHTDADIDATVAACRGALEDA